MLHQNISFIPIFYQTKFEALYSNSSSGISFFFYFNCTPWKQRSYPFPSKTLHQSISNKILLKVTKFHVTIISGQKAMERWSRRGNFLHTPHSK